MANDRFLYTGKTRKQPEPYLAPPELVKAVQFAQITNRPLLVKGEPGCGKSSLAEAIAYELFENDYEQYYFKWYVRSSSKAQDGLYQINHLERLRQANIQDGNTTDITLEKNQVKGAYIELGPLGKAFQVTNTMKKDQAPPVVLIDEIDKADMDFPNDLLLELDKMEFPIDEARTKAGEMVSIKAKKEKKPLIIVTSNDEKPLPPAFLRRCLFFYINFPGPERLYEIVDAREMPGMKDAALRSCCRLFSALRDAIETEGTASKNITTSELLDWITLINFHEKNYDKLFDIEKLDSVREFLNRYGVALAKDDATRQMLAEATKSAKVIQNVVESYKKNAK